MYQRDNNWTKDHTKAHLSPMGRQYKKKIPYPEAGFSLTLNSKLHYCSEMDTKLNSETYKRPKIDNARQTKASGSCLGTGLKIRHIKIKENHTVNIKILYQMHLSYVAFYNVFSSPIVTL